MLDKTVVHKNANMVTRVIGDEMVLVPVYRTSEEINCIYTFNKVASRIWEMLDGKTPLSKIKQRILKEFNTTSQEVDKELEKFFKELREIKAII